MSRIGNLPIELPKGVEVKIDKNHVTVKGAKGSLSQAFDLDITVKVEEGKAIGFEAYSIDNILNADEEFKKRFLPHIFDPQILELFKQIKQL